MCRPPHRKVSVGRDTGDAEHRTHTGVSRDHVTRSMVAFCCALAMLLVPSGVAHAQSTAVDVAATKRAIERSAERWFSAEARAADIDARIQSLEHSIAAARDDVAQARTVALQRALVMYEGASTGYSGVLGTSAIESARRIELIDNANAHNMSAIDAPTSAVATLRSQRADLVRQRSRVAKLLNEVAAERNQLEVQLARLESRAARDAAVAAAQRLARRAQRANHLAPPTAPPNDSAVSSTPGPPPSSGVNPHHDDPFLACTRTRESGGDYGAVSPSGLYYGAYQFLPATWDATAVHAGRDDLVGVLPSRASEYDQDEIAWVLYQWQGTAPWGGRC